MSRPTVAEIPATPFPDEPFIAQCAQRMTRELDRAIDGAFDGSVPRAPSPSDLPEPSREARQRLLPLVFT